MDEQDIEDPPKRRWWEQVLLGIDQLANAVAAGYAEETLSARSYRLGYLRSDPKPRWVWARTAINRLFFWQENHTEAAYMNEYNRAHLPGHYREDRLGQNDK